MATPESDVDKVAKGEWAGAVDISGLLSSRPFSMAQVIEEIKKDPIFAKKVYEETQKIIFPRESIYLQSGDDSQLNRLAKESLYKKPNCCYTIAA